MRTQCHTAALAALILMATPLLAAEAAKPAVHAAAATAAPAPVSELSQLLYFEGTWQCTGTAFANEMGPEHATTATVHGVKAVGGVWVNLSYDEHKTTANPNPFHAGLYAGYDAAKKQFVWNCHDSFGGYCAQTSAGWTGDSIKFEGTGNGGGKQFGVRDSFVKKGADQLTHTGEMQGDDKKWIKLDEETCKRGK